VPDVRQDRVAELKAKIETGNYQVSNQDIASAVAKDHSQGQES
jgi:anti-sigma28 factor (negative regulator of flagellin synthesis)